MECVTSGKVPSIVFFSWQKTRPLREQWTVIEDALESAVSQVALELEQTVVVTRDTVGIAGAPEIFEVIKLKIDSCAMAVFDVTFVGELVNGEKTPNPNVLVELGYALARLPSNRIMLVFNSEHGDVRALPFDLGKVRVATYQFGPEEKPAASRKALRENFTESLRDILNPPSFELHALEVGEKETELEVFVSNGKPFWLHIENDSPTAKIHVTVHGRIGKGVRWGTQPLQGEAIEALGILSTSVDPRGAAEVRVVAFHRGGVGKIKYGRR